jgi:parallel beta helix pectate lyase-like protein
MTRGYLLPLACGLFALGCSDESEPTIDAGCPAENIVGGVCAGVPSQPLCEESVCTTGSCSQVIQVTSQAELDAAIANASDGTCIALSPGSYGSVILPVGVSLFGHFHADTSVAAVTVLGGSDVRLRGFGVDGGTVTTSSGTAHIDAVRISNSSGSGVVVNTGASTSIEHSTIELAGRYGIEAFNVDDVQVRSTVIAGNSTSGGPGMWVQREMGCMGSGTVSATIEDSVLRGNKLVGLSLVGVSATIDNVAVRQSQVGPNFDAGGGVSISGCSTVTANALEVSDSADFGVLIDSSTVTLSTPTVTNNLRGVWIQNVTGSVTVDHATISNNTGVGVGIDGMSSSVTVQDSTITDTQMISLPVLVGGVSAGAEEVGDGLAWLGNSFAIIENVSISTSARASVLIDGEVVMGSSITNLTLAGGDEQKGIVQQNLPMNGQQPNTSMSPGVMPQPGEMFPVPVSPGIPPGI